MDRTIQRLVGVQAAAGLILLVLLAGVGTYVVRRSLRGLEDVEHTAVAIAGGDLSQRVPQRDPRTEVGRLSLALNQMLGQIETAFAQRTASEFAARRSEDDGAALGGGGQAVGGPDAAVRGGRFPRIADSADLDPWVRGAQPAAGGTPAMPDTMRRIEDEAKRMGLLVDDLLLLARLDQQRPLKMEPVDLLPIAATPCTTRRRCSPIGRSR